MPLDTAHNARQLTSRPELLINKSLYIPSVQAIFSLNVYHECELC